MRDDEAGHLSHQRDGDATGVAVFFESPDWYAGPFTFHSHEFLKRDGGQATPHD
jgi:hypothetical protein